MTKTEFTILLANRHNLSHGVAQKILNAFLDSVEDALFRDGRVALPGFGVFEKRQRAARTGRNPATGEIIDIPSYHNVAFKPALALKRLLILHK